MKMVIRLNLVSTVLCKAIKTLTSFSRCNVKFQFDGEWSYFKIKILSTKVIAKPQNF